MTTLFLFLTGLVAQLPHPPGEGVSDPTSSGKPIHVLSEATSDPSRWKGAIEQIPLGMAGGLFGATIGAGVGAALGLLVEAATADRSASRLAPISDVHSSPMTAIDYGLLIGAGIGNGLGTGLLVHLAADSARPSRNLFYPSLGGVLGSASGASLLYFAVPGKPLGAVVTGAMVGSAAGAVVFDRLTSKGAQGIRLSIRALGAGPPGLSVAFTF